MKKLLKSNLLALSVLFMAIGLTLSSCNKDSINGGSDNAGIVFNMRNDDGKRLDLLEADSVFQYTDGTGYLPTVYSPGNAGLGLNDNNNFKMSLFLPHPPFISAPCYIDISAEKCAITSVGPVKGLSKIKDIPQSGWVNEIAAQPGNGYVIRLIKYKVPETVYLYARVYVEDWLLSATDNGILGVTIRYEDNWKTE